MKKHIWTIMAVLIVLVSVLTIPVMADEVRVDKQAVSVVESGTCGDNLTWTLDTEGTLTISGTGAMPDNSWDGGIPWDSNRSDIKSIVIEDGVTNIGGWAFANCENLTSVDVGNTVMRICDYAFRFCNSLESVIFGESVRIIGAQAFYNCEKLSTITIPDGVTALGESAFGCCGSLTTVELPESIVSIGSWAFDQCGSLTAITIPDSITSIGDCTFSGCSNLTSVTIPEGVTVIGADAFKDCSSLTTIAIPDSVTSIESGAFCRCTGLNSVIMGNGITSIGTYTFSGCSSLSAITIPDGVTAIGLYAFSNCSSLTAITIPDSVTAIGSYAFNECSGLTSLTIGKSVTTIGDFAFFNCQSLTLVTIPGSVTSIGCYAFRFCNDLTIMFEGDAPTFDTYTFGNVTATAYYPANNATWTEDVMHNYGGTIIWEACSPIKITAQPADQTVKDGTAAQFVVEADGNDLTYQWQYRTSSSANWANAKADGNTTATLSVPASVSRHGYQYRCQITDGEGNIIYTDVATLNVLGIKTQPVSKTVKDGETAKFTVKATGTGLKYQWQYRTSSTGSWKTAKATGNATKTLSVSASVSRHGYQYRCRVTDSAGNKVYTKTVTLNVLGIKTQPVSKTVVDGRTAKFTVTATGDGLKYQWQYRTSSSGSWKNASATGNKTKTLSVPASVSRHGYQYRCKITDSAGNTVNTKAVSLYVLGIKTQPASKTVKVGATAKFTVAATGKGLTYQWQYKTPSSGSWKNASATGSKTKTLSVPGTISRSGYQYRCKITDSAGNVIYTKTVKLTVKK